MPGLAATVGSMHVCPMCSGSTPHVGGPISGPGVSTVLIAGKPAAVMGDMCVCIGPPDTIAQGCGTVLIGGKPAATVGDMTAHGGSITAGEPTVLIGTGGAIASVIMPIKKIPFPNITLTNRILGNTKEAIANQQKLKELSENNKGEPRIYNLQWVKEKKIIRESRELKEATLRAYVQNIADGESITFKVKKPVENTNETTEEFEDFIELTGTVSDKIVEVVWEIDITEGNEEEVKK
ncbi:PAAR domain-containing protein [Tenacibaculum sp.]|uniref:PAAR domain-containing protein n=1 Tax=Tenacibaculum sp. TaxID=1906242 RepID=UPI003D0B1D08